MATQDALKLAKDSNLDLVEINPNASPAVCKIMDFGKYCYLEKKKSQESKKKQKVVQLKEIKLRPNIGKSDLEVKVKSIKKFLEKKDKVKITMKFRGREITHQEIGKSILDTMLLELYGMHIVDVPIKKEGNNNLVMILSSK